MDVHGAALTTAEDISVFEKRKVLSSIHVDGRNEMSGEKKKKFVQHSPFLPSGSLHVQEALSEKHEKYLAETPELRQMMHDFVTAV